MIYEILCLKIKIKIKIQKKATAPRYTDWAAAEGPRAAQWRAALGSPGQALAAADAPVQISLYSSQFGEEESGCLWVLASVHFLRKWVVKNSSHGCPV